MYFFLLLFHSYIRWLVLGSLLYAIYRAYKGYAANAVFTKADDAARHWMATISHIQLVIGFALYLKSPLVKYFFANFGEAIHDTGLTFFGIIHIALMLAAIIVITIGAALAKRQTTDRDKFRIMLWWFSIALLVICIAVPWAFSPLAQRPYIRTF